MTDGFQAFFAAVSADPRIELHSLLALHRGEPVVEAYWAPWIASDRVHVYSASKTVTAAAVGIAIGEGRFGLHDKVAALIEPDRPVDPRIAEITVHHLLSMSTGHSADPDWAEGEDPVDHFFVAVPEEPVGSRHAYNNLASFLLGELVRRASGQSLVGYLRPRLFEPLGIDATWATDEQGRELGYAGLRVTTSELARIGELYRLGGVWDGRQLIPSGFVAASGTRQIPTGPGPDHDWTTGYGYQAWISREGYRLDGAYGQFCLVLPERESVIALTSAQATGSQPLLDLVFEHLVPAVGRGVPAAAPGELAVAVCTDNGAPGPWWCAEPEGAGAVGGSHFRELRLARTGDGWRLTATVDGDPVHLPIPGPGWHRTSLALGGHQVPAAVAVGVDEAGADVLVAFTATVHTLELRVGAGVGREAWRTVPLGGPELAELIAE